MMTIITLLCIGVSICEIAILNSFAYAISLRLCRRINKWITTSYVRQIFALLSTYMNFRFVGEKNLLDELPKQYLIVSNHQSLLDIPLYMRFLDGPRLRFVAKAELGKYVPTVSVMLRSDQHCLVKRAGSPGKTMKELDKFAARVQKNNWIPIIFPEGTRSVNGELGTFHAAGFRRFLDQSPMPVAVCALEGGWRISSIRGMAIHLRGGSYRVKVLRIYPAPTSKAEQVTILEEGRNLIQKQLDLWRKKEQLR